MKLFSKKTLMGVMAGIAGLFFVSISASATPVLFIYDPVANTSISITDGGAGDNSAAGDGIVNYSGTFGAFNLSVNVGSSKPDIGSASQPALHLTSFASSSGAGQLIVWFSDTDFLGGSNISSSLSSGGSGTLTFDSSACADLTNSNITSSTCSGLQSSILNQTSPGGFTSTSFNFDASGVNLYGLGIGTVITASGAGQTGSVDLQLSVPEPGILGLLGLGLVGLGLAARRRRQA